MAIQSFSVGQVLTAAQVNALQANDYNQTVSNKTASYTLVAADKGTRITMSSTSATTITVNTNLFSAGDTLFIQNLNTGVSTITAGTATVTTSASLALAQWEGGILYFTSASAAIFFKSAGAATPAGNKTISLIASGSMPAASSLNLTGITQDYMQLQIFGLQWNSGQSRIQMQVNSNTGSIYRQTSFSNISGGGDQISGLSTQIDFNTSGAYNAYGDTWYSITIQNCATTGYKNYQYLQFSKNNANTFFITGAGQGVIETSVALTSIQIINSNAYNYNAGTYRLVGG